MKKFVIAAALAMIGASARAGTYNVEGVTIHFQDGCRSSSCVSVYAPDYGYYHAGSSARLHKAHKDAPRVAAMTKKDDTVATPAAAAPAIDAASAAPAATPDKTPEAAPQVTPSDPTAAK